MYINTFKYTPKDVSCQLCTEYVKKLGCTALRCPWLAERIEAGVVGYREAVLETFPRDRRLSSRLNLLIKHYPGSLWSNEQHERRMQYQCAVQGYLRKMAIDGYVVKLDLPELRELVSLLRYSSNNLNQFTRRAHETGRIYETDLEDIQQSQERIWTAAEKIVSSLAALK